MTPEKKITDPRAELAARCPEYLRDAIEELKGAIRMSGLSPALAARLLLSAGFDIAYDGEKRIEDLKRVVPYAEYVRVYEPLSGHWSNLASKALHAKEAAEYLDVHCGFKEDEDYCDLTELPR
jgi:hypothetical protein